MSSVRRAHGSCNRAMRKPGVSHRDAAPRGITATPAPASTRRATASNPDTRTR